MRCGLSNLSAVAGSIILAGLLALSVRASANEGSLRMGGSPGLLTGHPTVTMTSELVKMTVGKENVAVDCRFVFTNHGPACTVRMGFPDQGEGYYDPDEETEPATVMKTPPHSTFDSFRSYVEGKECQTKLIRADREGKFWHTKMVTFPAYSVLHIRDVYTQRISNDTAARVGNEYVYALEVAYILHTGASWHGKIGRTEVDVTFPGKRITGSLHTIPLKSVTDKPDGHKLRNGDPLKVNPFRPNSVVWTGPCVPIVEGKTLRFVIKNWRPKPTDDLLVLFEYVHP